ncbi:hypothetical protein ACFQX6_61445 [Streptosporangium lutulentum]
MATAINPVIHPELGHRVRTTVVLAAAMLARTGQVMLPYPGGDAFCPRLIDRHLAAMQAAAPRSPPTPPASAHGADPAAYRRSRWT